MNYQEDRREQSKPVIIHQSLSNSDIIALLRDSNYFIRFSSTVIKDSCIFPSSSVAFLIVDDVFNSRRQTCLPQSTRLASTNEQGEHNDSDRSTELLNRMEKFSRLHQRCFVILRYSVFDSFATESLQNIQLKFLESRLQVIPVLNDNGQSVVEAMLNIAKVMCKPVSEVLKERLESIQASFKSSVTLMHETLKMLDLSPEEINLVQDGIGSLKKLILATEQDLLDCGLSREVVVRIQRFFS
uniref:Uncharacterized protein n=1 Tax=Octopus bimaculoides TaxID=37653 RepID=A0A0L8GZE0_OCTBM